VLSPPLPPSGRQLEISHGEQRATIVEIGAGLRSYSIGDRAILDGYAVDEMCSGGRGQLLVPWPNRIRDGRYTWEGVSLQLPLSEVVRRHAIHGLVRWARWTVEAATENRAVLSYRLHPQPGYPFTVDLNVVYEIDGHGLTVTVRATNAGQRRCPFGAGAHPYLTVGTALVDDVVLELRAETWLRTDELQIPVARDRVAGSPFDFRHPRRIGDLHIDHAFTDLARDADGRARIRISAEHRGVVLWMGPELEYVEVYTGDTLPAGHRRRRSLAVEPMTCAPNAFQSGEGLLVLEPGGSLVTSWGIDPNGT
jgi:aldose 1-epimerase